MDYTRDVEMMFHEIVCTFSLENLQKILGGIPNQALNGDKLSLRKQLICLLTSNDLPLRCLAHKKMLEVYWLQTLEMRQDKIPFVNQSNISQIQKLLVDPSYNEVINFEHDLPFFKTLYTILPPVYCDNEFQNIYLNGFFHLKKSIRDCIVKSWNDDTKTYTSRIFLRFEQIGEKSFNERLPYNINVSVNDLKCLLPEFNMPVSGVSMSNVSTSAVRNTIPWQSNIPIDITEYSDLKTSLMNTLDIQWSKDSNSFIVGVFVAQKLTWQNLLVELQKRPFRVAQKTLELIKESMENEIDLGVDTLVTTIEDPLTKLKMELPARGIGCTHLQCFDAINFLQMNEQKQTWSCPLCMKQVKFKNIEVDEYFLNIVQNPSLSKECKNIVLLKDGTWAERKINAFSSKSRTNNCKPTNNIEVITLSDSEDNC